MISFSRLTRVSHIALLGSMLLLWGTPLHAQVSFSGFGTLGYAFSDKSYDYQRFVDHSGTFSRDSHLGLQMDAHLSDQFSLVVQGKIAPSIKNDLQWDPTLTWAFVAWRPTNDLLIRAGRIRIPIYLNSANLDVGVTYDPAQLPIEIYSTSPTNDGDGIAVNKTWESDIGELSFDAYYARSRSYWRLFTRDDNRAFQADDHGPFFFKNKLESTGVALTLTREDNIYRIGYHQAEVRPRNGGDFPTDYPFVSVIPGTGYYRWNNALPLPGPIVSTVDTARNGLLTLGMDLNVGSDFRLSGEYARRAILNNPRIGPDTHAGYLLLQRKAGPWTPYISIARLRSTSPSLSLFESINGTRVSSGFIFTPSQAAFINAMQRLGADRLVVYDQGTVALGTSYLLSPNQKIKAEWAITHIGKVSNFVDVPQGGDINRTNIQVFSMSYNFTF